MVFLCMCGRARTARLCVVHGMECKRQLKFSGTGRARNNKATLS